jgi:hypothetical protein
MQDRVHNQIIKRLVVLAILLLPGSVLFPATHAQPERNASVRLGERLFRDARFSTPKGDLPASCSTCHLLDEDPQGVRGYADFFNRSWVSSRMKDRRRLEIRNSPTILDVADMPRLHFDGEFASLLDDVIKELFELSLMARKGLVREADDDLATINIGMTDIKPHVAFLQSLDDELAKTTPKRSAQR